MNELLNAEDMPDGTPRYRPPPTSRGFRIALGPTHRRSHPCGDARAASEVIEHQVDVIKSLQQQKDTLSQRILELNERVRTLESTVTIQ